MIRSRRGEKAALYLAAVTLLVAFVLLRRAGAQKPEPAVPPVDAGLS